MQVTCTAEWRLDQEEAIKNFSNWKKQNSNLAASIKEKILVGLLWPAIPSILPRSYHFAHACIQFFQVFFTGLIQNDNPWFGLFGSGRCFSTF